MLNLLITASVGCYTYQHGATELLISPDQFQAYLQQLVIPELEVKEGQDIDDLPLLKATCIKFVYIFRNQIPDDHVQQFVQVLAAYLKSSMIVNQSYAAASIEKMFVKK